jgi:hypothetical protein
MNMGNGDCGVKMITNAKSSSLRHSRIHRSCGNHYSGKTTSLQNFVARQQCEVRLQEVTRVIAFKRDQWTVDCICFAFELNGKETIEVSENMEGWAALVDAVPVRLPGALRQEEWWDKVVSPTFEPCLTNIYPRA